MGHKPLIFNSAMQNVISECTTCLKLAKDGSEKQGSISPVATLIVEYFGTVLYGGHGSLSVQGMFSWKRGKHS